MIFGSLHEQHQFIWMPNANRTTCENIIKKMYYFRSKPSTSDNATNLLCMKMKFENINAVTNNLQSFHVRYTHEIFSALRFIQLFICVFGNGKKKLCSSLQRAATRQQHICINTYKKYNNKNESEHFLWIHRKSKILFQTKDSLFAFWLAFISLYSRKISRSWLAYWCQ